MHDRVVQIREQRLIVSQDHYLLLAVQFQLSAQNVDYEVAAPAAFAQLGDHCTEFGVPAVVRFDFIEVVVGKVVLDALHYHIMLHIGFFFVHNFTKKHFKHFCQPVLAGHCTGQPQRVPRCYFYHAPAKHFGAHVVAFIKHGQSKVAERGVVVFLHGQRLQHSNDDVLVFNIDFLALDSPDARAG